MGVTFGLPSGACARVDADPVLIGTDEDCQVRLPADGRVRPRHARVRRTAGRWLVESAGDWPVQVGDGPPGRLGWLRPGDVIRLSEAGPDLTFEPSALHRPSPPAPAAPAAASTVPESEGPVPVAPVSTGVGSIGRRGPPPLLGRGQGPPPLPAKAAPPPLPAVEPAPEQVDSFPRRVEEAEVPAPGVARGSTASLPPVARRTATNARRPLGRSAKLGLLIGAVVVLVGGSVLLLRGAMMGKGGAVDTTASRIMQELREYREKADREFRGKTFTVTGTVSQVVTNSIYLEATDEEYRSLGYCKFGSGRAGDTTGYESAVKLLKNIKPGQSVAVKCVFDRMWHGNTFFNHCQLADGPGESLVELVRRCNGFKGPFDAKYRDKRLRITGGMKEATKSFDDWHIRFETDTEDELHVRCMFKGKHDEALQSLNRGDTVTIEGVCRGSSFANFEQIVLHDGDLISPSRGRGTAAREADDPGHTSASVATAGRVTHALVASKVRPGMTPAQVRAALGRPDEERPFHLPGVTQNGQTLAPAVNQLTLQYNDTPDGTIVILFSDGKAVAAASLNGGTIFFTR